jgi:hypothetical protein
MSTYGASVKVRAWSVGPPAECSGMRNGNIIAPGISVSAYSRKKIGSCRLRAVAIESNTETNPHWCRSWLDNEGGIMSGGKFGFSSVLPAIAYLTFQCFASGAFEDSTNPSVPA